MNRRSRIARSWMKNSGHWWRHRGDAYDGPLSHPASSCGYPNFPGCRLSAYAHVKVVHPENISRRKFLHCTNGRWAFFLRAPFSLRKRSRSFGSVTAQMENAPSGPLIIMGIRLSCSPKERFAHSRWLPALGSFFLLFFSFANSWFPSAFSLDVGYVYRSRETGKSQMQWTCLLPLRLVIQECNEWGIYIYTYRHEHLEIVRHAWTRIKHDHCSTLHILLTKKKVAVHIVLTETRNVDTTGSRSSKYRWMSLHYTALYSIYIYCYYIWNLHWLWN